MAYTAWSVVFGEQPSTSKWNILGSNDSSFNDGTGIFGLKKDLLATDSNPYKFSVYRNAAQNSGSSAFVKLNFDTELFDTNNNFTGGSYTVPISGFYDFNARTSATAASQMVIALYKNSSVFRRGSHVKFPSDSGGVVYNDLVQCTLGDVIDFYLYTDNAVAIEVGAITTWASGSLRCRT